MKRVHVRNCSAFLVSLSTLLFLGGCEEAPTGRDSPADPSAPAPVSVTSGPGETVSPATERGVLEIFEPDIQGIGELPEEGPLTASSGGLTPASVTLPVNEGIVTSATAFRVAQGGTGHAGWFRVNTTANDKIAMVATHEGSGTAIRGINTGTGRGVWGQVANSSSGATALQGTTSGSGIGVFGFTTGTGPAGLFEISNTSNASAALQATTDGSGSAGVFVSGSNAPTIDVENTGSGFGTGVFARSNGQAFEGRSTGTAFAGFFQSEGTGGGVSARSDDAPGLGVLQVVGFKVDAGDQLARFHAAPTGGGGAATVVRIDHVGKVFANGGFQTGGADLAEALQVTGSKDRYEPGDVLSISRREGGKMEMSSGPYATRVIGVYATRPGVVLSEDGIEEPMGEKIPVAVVGIVPTKVIAENGPIRPGDLLVTASRPGHAMRATESRIRHGSVLGKALEEFRGPGTGTIRVMVNVR